MRGGRPQTDGHEQARSGRRGAHTTERVTHERLAHVGLDSSGAAGRRRHHHHPTPQPPVLTRSCRRCSYPRWLLRREGRPATAGSPGGLAPQVSFAGIAVSVAGAAAPGSVRHERADTSAGIRAGLLLHAADRALSEGGRSLATMIIKTPGRGTEEDGRQGGTTPASTTRNVGDGESPSDAPSTPPLCPPA